MLRYFLKILFILFFLTTPYQIVFGEVVLLSPVNGEFLHDPSVYFTWENTDTEREYIYKHFLFTNGTLTDGAISRVIEEKQIARGLSNYQIYLWKVQYHPKESFNGVFEYETAPYIFSVNKEIPKERLDEFLKTGKVEEDVREKLQEDVRENTEESVEREEEVEEEENRRGKVEVDSSLLSNPPREHSSSSSNQEESKYNVTEKYQASFLNDSSVQESEFNWNVVSSKSVLGVSKEQKQEEPVCKFKYLKRRNTLEEIYCNIPKLEITQESKYPFANEYTLFLKGKVETNYAIQIDEYMCDFNLLKPTTWFKCKERLVQSKILHLKPNMFFHIYKEERRVTVLSFFLEGNEFRMLAGHVSDMDNLRLIHTTRMVHKEYDFYHEQKSEYSIKPKEWEEQDEDLNIKKPFSFPLKKITGVTQWYGHTAYQNPHTGIDFGAKQKHVLALSDGEVVGKGWDSYYGECLSGGNFLKIKQHNGMHTIYFHLDEIYVNTGESVKREQVIAKSGNSGAWNCQRLAYHLHLETRKNQSSSSHRNPVKHINANWDLIPTLGYNQYPGRLTGENPHPGR